MALPVEQKQAHVHSYEDPEDWLKWYLAALAKYNDEHPANPIDGDIDLSGFLQ